MEMLGSTASAVSPLTPPVGGGTLESVAAGAEGASAEASGVTSGSAGGDSAGASGSVAAAGSEAGSPTLSKVWLGAVTDDGDVMGSISAAPTGGSGAAGAPEEAGSEAGSAVLVAGTIERPGPRTGVP